ncbi:MAG TPA: DUF983 domain-containing protein [Euzebya sp.]|nr:DUF983 domain-containing protein [Euzebya sp.]
MQNDQGPVKLSHALRMRCPLCGHKPITHAYGEIIPQCPGCGYEFEQGESGYYTGALIMNMAVCLVSFAVTFGLGLALTWPDVPWTALSYICIAAMVVVPIWFYPRSKTVWIWADLRIHPYASDERPGR